MAHSKQNKQNKSKAKEDGKYRQETRDEKRIRLQQIAESREVREDLFLRLFWGVRGSIPVRVSIHRHMSICDHF